MKIEASDMLSVQILYNLRYITYNVKGLCAVWIFEKLLLNLILVVDYR